MPTHQHAAQHAKSHTSPSSSLPIWLQSVLVFLSGTQKIRFLPPGYHHNSRLICALKNKHVIHLQVCYYRWILVHTLPGTLQHRKRFWADPRDTLMTLSHLSQEEKRCIESKEVKNILGNRGVFVLTPGKLQYLERQDEQTLQNKLQSIGRGCVEACCCINGKQTKYVYPLRLISFSTFSNCLPFAILPWSYFGKNR